ncbi:TetR/AcrR family transcriptional regulator [Paenibacillus solisilvae]|uniref:TetR/AcrR family transcriptional regulator n=1 Tax=Paenibacillus solisilvae TaxID=2486751 RepID=A0ABW0W9A3_9BACL
MKRVNDPKSDISLEERREQIIKAALIVFAKRGIGGTKMSMIASEAGISHGLSYRYFSSKEELFTVLVQKAIDQAQAAIRNVSHLSCSPKEQIRAFTQQMLDENHKHFYVDPACANVQSTAIGCKRLII